MKSWYQRITRDPDDLSPVIGAMDHFEGQYLEALDEMNDLRGLRLIEVEKRFPGIVGYRYGQLEELESIISYLEIREDAIVGAQRRFYVEHYNRKLTDQMVNKFAESHPDVIAIRELRNHVAAVRNKFVALSRQHEYMQYQLGNISKLVSAGVPDVTF